MLVRHVDDHRRPAEQPVELAGDRGGGVDDQDVTGVQVLGKVAEPHVVDPVGRADEQPHLVAREATLLGRLGREVRGGEPGVRGLAELGRSQAGHPRSSAR